MASTAVLPPCTLPPPPAPTSPFSLLVLTVRSPAHHRRPPTLNPAREQLAHDMVCDDAMNLSAVLCTGTRGAKWLSAPSVYTSVCSWVKQFSVMLRIIQGFRPHCAEMLAPAVFECLRLTLELPSAVVMLLGKPKVQVYERFCDSATSKGFSSRIAQVKVFFP